MSEPSKSVDGELIRLFYDLWEAGLPGQDYLVSSDVPESIDRLARSSAADVNRTLRYMNRLGHLITHGPLDADFVVTLVGKEVIRTVTRALPLLRDLRAKRSEPDYMEYVDRLLELCRAKYPDYEPHYLSEERRGVGLML